MSRIIEIDSLGMLELAPYVSLAKGKSRAGELIVAESPKVIERALDAGLQPQSLLCEMRHIEGDAASILKRIPEIPVYTGDRALLASLTGYELTRGVLCAMRRPGASAPEELLTGARRVCVIYDVCDATNVGVIFRSAAALGYDGVIVSSRTCDPLGRRAVRVSMGAVFQIPWATLRGDLHATLAEFGFSGVSMALAADSLRLQDFKVEENGKYAVILGSEGYGLPEEIIDKSAYTVKIPMSYGVDSLNVGAAAAIALWHFRP